MTDQLIVGDKASFDDFEASLASRNIGMPPKKSIKETVPFSNVTYDFSAINGELYWEERKLEYVFEIIAETPERLEELKSAFSSWMMNVQNDEIHDPFIPDYHFVGTFDDIKFEDEESLDKTTVSVTFTAYPYKIANLPKVLEFVLSGALEATYHFENNSSHRIFPTVAVTSSNESDNGTSVSLHFNSESSTTVKVGNTYSGGIALPVGVTKLGVAASYFKGRLTITVSFSEEVF